MTGICIEAGISSKTLPYSIMDTIGYPVGARDTDVRLTIGTEGSIYMLEY